MKLFNNYVIHVSIVVFFCLTYFVSGWFINNPQDSYSLPLVIYFLPDIIGWYGFFIFIGMIAGCFGVALVLWLNEILNVNKRNMLSDEETLDLEQEKYEVFVTRFIYARESGYVNFDYDGQSYNVEVVEKLLKEKLENK